MHTGFELTPDAGKRRHLGFLSSLPRCGETEREGGAFSHQQLDVRNGPDCENPSEDGGPRAAGSWGLCPF